MIMSEISGTTVPHIKACLFDMDGLLIDTEEKYTAVKNEILAEYGRPNVPWSVKAQLMGRPQDQANKLFLDWAQMPITEEQYLEKVKTLQKKMFPTAKPLPGVRRLLADLASTADSDNPVHIALATSSTQSNFELKTSYLKDLFAVFPTTRRVFGDNPLVKGRGKPLPDIYLLALESINSELREQGEAEIKPGECLVFEDSVSGVEAGRRAGMQVAWVPLKPLLEIYSEVQPQVLAGMVGETDRLDVPCLAEPEAWRANSPGQPGHVNDGYGRLYSSLENFPYETYGIRIPESIPQESLAKRGLAYCMSLFAPIGNAVWRGGTWVGSRHEGAFFKKLFEPLLSSSS